MKRDFWRRVLDAMAGPDRAIRRELEQDLASATEVANQFQARVREQDREIERLRLMYEGATRAAEILEERHFAREQLLREYQTHDGEQAPGGGGSPERG